ncbi:MAG: phosphoglucomutase/phosphomannomutase family protein [Chloroflexi bacterium]|nr:phosphoglucomutase/phosphomannomutase family protein [Chloroflexota bacterium]
MENKERLELKQNPIKFGTDGWRAVIAEEFTFDNVRICAQATADYLKQTNLASRGLVIGYDTRFASEDFAAAAAEVVAANRIKVYLTTKATPTPVVSYGVVNRKAGGAIIITASHNPARWNGFKLKSPDGSSAPTEAIVEVEKHISRILTQNKIERMPLAQARQKGLVEDVDLAEVFLQHVAKFVGLDKIRKSNLKIIHDAMFGAGTGYFKTLLSGGNIDFAEINGERNPAFPGINPEPITPNLTKLSALVKEQKASVGLATDGDADRIGIIDENGRFINQLEVFALLCLYLLEVRGERGPIVKTVTASSMLFRLGELFDVPVYETAVGFKEVAPVMLAQNALIGGEESGGYGFRGHIPERDSVLAGLYFLDFMVQTGKTPSQLLQHLFSKVGPHYYNRIDAHFSAAERETIIKRVKDSNPRTIEGVQVARVNTMDGFQFILTDGSWLLIRFSGTEPVLRIYAESDSNERVAAMLAFGKKMAGV